MANESDELIAYCARCDFEGESCVSCIQLRESLVLCLRQSSLQGLKHIREEDECGTDQLELLTSYHRHLVQMGVHAFNRFQAQFQPWRTPFCVIQPSKADHHHLSLSLFPISKAIVSNSLGGHAPRCSAQMLIPIIQMQV